MSDYYKVLGIKRDASQSDVKVAFRKLALKFHPDRHANSSEHNKNVASQHFKKLLEAYEVLNDEKKRRVYNREGRAGFNYPRAGTTYHRQEANYGRHAAGDASRGAYQQGPFRGQAAPSGKRNSPFQMRWKFGFGFSRVDYLFHGLIAIVAVIGFTAVDKLGDSLWKIRNSGKSFEETIEGVEHKKRAREEDKTSPAPR